MIPPPYDSGPKPLLKDWRPDVDVVIAAVVILGSALVAVLASIKSWKTHSCFGKPGAAPWPVESREIVNSYLNPQVGSNGLDSPHEGIDIAASITAPVFAVEAGVVVAIDNEDSLTGIVVESSTQPGYGFFYQHILPSSLLVNGLGAVVSAGEQLGEVLEFTAASDFDHLHLERVAQFSGAADKDREFVPGWSDHVSDRNPLAFLAPSSEDTSKPAIEPLSSTEEFELYSDCGLATPSQETAAIWLFRRPSVPWGQPESACPLDLKTDEVYDVYCKVLEWPLNGIDEHKIAPTCATTTIKPMSGQSVPAWAFEQVLDGNLATPGIKSPFSSGGNETLKSAGQLTDERTFYLRTTLALDGTGGWKPSEGGSYLVQVTLCDAAGRRSAPASFDVFVN